MVIETPPDIRIVEDYDIESITGNSLTVTIDPFLGDSIHITPTQISIFVAPRQSLHDKSKTHPAETTTVNASHVFAVRRREREVMNMTVEQQVEWSRDLTALGARMH